MLAVGRLAVHEPAEVALEGQRCLVGALERSLSAAAMAVGLSARSLFLVGLVSTAIGGDAAEIRARTHKMEYEGGGGTVRIELMNPGFEGHVLEVETGGLWREPYFVLDGAPATPGSSPTTFILHRADGAEAIGVIRRSASLVDPIPRAAIDGQSIEVRRRPRWYELAWAALPLLLGLSGIAGLLIGAIAALQNYRIMRLPGGVGRWIRTLFTSLMAAVIVGLVFYASLLLTGNAQLATADRAVERFHVLLDAGDARGIVSEADPLLTSQASSTTVIQTLAAIHQKLGAVRSSSRSSWFVNQQVSTSVTGTFLRVVYATEFAAGMATETFIWRIDGDHTSLASYHVESNALLR